MIVLTEQEIHSGNLIVVNALHPYLEEASEREMPARNAGVPEGEQIFQNTDAAKRKMFPVCPERPDILLEGHAQQMLSALMEEIGGWKEIVPVSGFRSYREQQEIFDTSLRENGEAYTRKFVALPGCSEHQTGLAIDLALKKEEIDFICPDFPYEGICQKFRKRAAAYGFVERYQEDKTDITGIAREPWHFRYTGRPHAEIMNALGMCLEEYVEFLKQFPCRKRYYEYRMEAEIVKISYLPADKGTVCLKAEDGEICGISGNNMDGYIITERK